MSELDTATVELPLPVRNKPKRAWVRKEIVSLYGTPYQPTFQDMMPDNADERRSEDDINGGKFITGSGRAVVELKRDRLSEASTAFENSYHEKIQARKCLNLLVDIRSGLIRQNRFLETLIKELEDPGIDLFPS